MKDLKQMTAAALLRELDYYKGRAEPMKDCQAAEHAHFTAVWDEVQQRLTYLEMAKEAERADHVVAFAGSASTVICNLWTAHGGKTMDSDQAADFAKLLFDFFEKVG